ncbi:AraC family transcriptional regulator [Sediminitomix flava]|uniref:AraC family transcriptional activator of pobA n=1 Tax=Sediminitomix flava TaxID=379075 RepID=A0A316A5H4_SEDFL|nr:helix-turn-helix transcriptional regulator [Sediminitomix flava]PWJ45017.1 AraC family transcriptional activator of pobA [Sediminitomix flava]
MNKNDKHPIPLQTIENSLALYKHLHAPAPSFGMDIFSEDFEAKDVVILGNNGEGNKGIPIRCDHFVMVLCVSGESHRRINHHRFQIRPQTAHFILPGQIHSFSNTTDDFEIYILLFERSFLAQSKLIAPILDNLLQLDVDCTPSFELTKSEFEDWIHTYQQIAIETKTRDKYYQDILTTHISNLLWKVKRKTASKEHLNNRTNRQEELFTQFKQFIEKYYLEKRTVSEFAELLFISPKHLSETVKEVTNHTALYFIHERMLHEAEYLLVYSSLNIKEIADALRFENPTHFGRFFKKYKAVTPVQFRLMNK